MKIKKYKDWGIFYKILSVVAIPLILFALLFNFFIIPSIESKLYEEKRTAIKQPVDVAYNAIVGYYELYKKGELTQDEAKSKAKEAIRGFRFNADDYFWINDMYPNMIVHPFKPELEGKSLRDNKDPNGKRIFVEMVESVKNSKGEGFVDYMWSKPGYSEPVPKISAVKLFKEWEWIVGSGIYVDDVESEISALIVFILTVLIAFLIAKFISKALVDIDKAAQKVASGDTDVEIEIDSQDEVGRLASSFRNLIAGQKEKVIAAEQIAEGNLLKLSWLLTTTNLVKHLIKKLLL